jgi:tRNA A-37 threonylcarbamoyl transferase component Bud32
MITTLTALPAGRGVYRLASFTRHGVDVPMVSVLIMKNGYVPFIDGENLRDDLRSSSACQALHNALSDYLTRHGVKYGHGNIHVVSAGLASSRSY